MSTRHWYRWDGATLELRIRAHAQAKTNRVEEPIGDTLRVRLHAPPIEGRANRALIDLLASAFSVPKRCVRIRHGLSSRIKLVCIDRPQKIPPSLRGAIRRTGLT